MPRRKDDHIAPELPVKVTVTITGDQLDDVATGLLDIAGALQVGYTSGEVKALRGHRDGYEFKTVQL